MGIASLASPVLVWAPVMILSLVQIAMTTGLPYTILRDALLTHPTLVESLIPLFSSMPSVAKSAAAKS
jgi:hypothetical protein